MERSTKSLRRVLEVSANLGIVIVALIIVRNFVAKPLAVTDVVVNLGT